MTNVKLDFRFIFLLSFLALAISCKKNSDEPSASTLPEGTMTFKANGTLRTYTRTTARETGINGAFRLEIEGEDTTSNSGNHLGISMDSKTDIVGGFSFNQDTKVSANFQSGTFYFDDDTYGFLPQTPTYGDAKPQYELTIIERTATNVKGKFSGKFYTNEAPSAILRYTVTEGVFNAKVSAY